MAEAFMGEIRMFAGIFAPHKWGFCGGALLSISNYQALFSLLGTTYGGDGRTSFALPDMRGRIPVGQGSGPGLTPRNIGNVYGNEYHTLSISEMPVHTHVMQGSNDAVNTPDPDGMMPGKVPSGEKFYDNSPTPDGQYGLDTLNEGLNDDHFNVMPSLVIHFIICLEGIYPSRN